MSIAPPTPEDPRHGTVAGYNRIPCREECCKAAYRRYRKAWHLERGRGQHRVISALGAQRRIQALAALGWSNASVARAAGLSPEYLHRILDYATVRRETHKRIDDVYQRMSMTLPTEHPQTISATRNRAARNGWASPLAWENIDDPAEKPAGRYQAHRRTTEVDEAVVLRLLGGERIDCTRAERDEAMRRWRAAGKPEKALCRMQGWKDSRYGREVAA